MSRASEESSSDCLSVGELGLGAVTRGRRSTWDSGAGMVWESSETFYVALIGPFVKSHHLIHIHIMSIPLMTSIGG